MLPSPIQVGLLSREEVSHGFLASLYGAMGRDWPIFLMLEAQI